MPTSTPKTNCAEPVVEVAAEVLPLLRAQGATAVGVAGAVPAEVASWLAFRPLSLQPPAYREVLVCEYDQEDTAEKERGEAKEANEVYGVIEVLDGGKVGGRCVLRLVEFFACPAICPAGHSVLQKREAEREEQERPCQAEEDGRVLRRDSGDLLQKATESASAPAAPARATCSAFSPRTRSRSM